MKNLCLLPLLICFGLVVSVCSNVTAAPSPETILTVNGTGVCEAAPEQATLDVGVTTHAAISSAAQETNAAQTRAVLDALKELGLAPGDIQTGNYSFYPTYGDNRNETRQINGYTVHNSVTVKIRNLEMVGAVIDTALKNGANNINSLEFGLRERKNLRRTAIKQAVADARDKAEIIAKELGLKIKGIKSISENVGAPMNLRNGNRLLAMAKAESDTAIEAGTMTLTADVHIEYVLGE